MNRENSTDIFYKNVLLDKSVLHHLSDYTKQWLDCYNSLSPEEQEASNYEPSELAEALHVGAPSNDLKVVFTAGTDTTPPTTIYDCKSSA